MVSVLMHSCTGHTHDILWPALSLLLRSLMLKVLRSLHSNLCFVHHAVGVDWSFQSMLVER